MLYARRHGHIKADSREGFCAKEAQTKMAFALLTRESVYLRAKAALRVSSFDLGISQLAVFRHAFEIQRDKPPHTYTHTHTREPTHRGWGRHAPFELSCDDLDKSVPRVRAFRQFYDSTFIVLCVFPFRDSQSAQQAMRPSANLL